MKIWIKLLFTIAFLSVPSAASATSYILKSANKKSFGTSTVYDASRPLKHHVRSNDRLYFSYGVVPSTHALEGTFRFKVLVASGHGETVVFDHELSPQTNARDAGWHREKIPLDQFRDQDIQFSFRSERVRAGLSTKSPSEALWGGVRVGDFVRKSGEYNVILISLDTLRWDRLGIAGNQRPTSTYIDKIAREGAYFMRGVSQCSWTKPSHMSVFTGLFPSAHGLQDRWNFPGGRRQPPASMRMLAEEMRDGGYMTAAFTGSCNVSAVFGFDRGFDEFHEVATSMNGDGRFVFRGGRRWIDDHADEKFFLFLHTYEIHEPYTHDHFVDSRTKDATALLFQRYDSGIFFVDRLIGGLRKDLEDRGLLDKTIIVIFSDHGEGLNDRPHVPAHGRSLYDELVLVPIIFRAPELVRPRIFDRYQAQLVDLMPTILDLVGLRVPDALDGTSLVPILRGQTASARSIAISELSHPIQPGGDLLRTKDGIPYAREGAFNSIQNEERAIPSEKMRMLRSIRLEDLGKRLKLIFCPGFADGSDANFQMRAWEGGWRDSRRNLGRQFFDLGKDPGELRPLPVTGSEDAAFLEKTLLERVMRHAHPQLLGDSSNEKEISPELSERLRALGY